LTRHQKSPENVEKAKALFEMGWTPPKIARDIGVNPSTIRRWLEEPETEEEHDKLELIRNANRQRYVDEAWEIVFDLNRIVKEKLAKGESGFSNARDAATTMGIYFDKISLIEARARKSGDRTSNLNIVLVPPDGYAGQAVGNPVQVYDVEGEVLRDDMRSGGGEDLLRLSEGHNGSAAESGEPRDDSGIDLPESERLHSPDADRGTVDNDGEPERVLGDSGELQPPEPDGEVL
jgi:hypothetical protein